MNEKGHCVPFSFRRRETLVLSALMWLSGVWEPFFVQFHCTVVAPDAPGGLVILSLGVSTSQFASAYILTNYERECADPLVFERGLARGRADPSDFEGGSAHTLIKLIDLEKDTKERVLTPWIDNLAFPQQAYRTKLWRCGEMCLSSHRQIGIYRGA